MQKICFDRYNKLKRTYQALSSLIEENQNGDNPFDSIATSFRYCNEWKRPSQIMEELTEGAHIKKHSTKNRNLLKSKRSTHASSNGYDIYVGKK